MKMDFDNFVKVQNKDYPGSIISSLDSDQSKVKLKLKMSGFSTNKINSFNIKIPEKYEQVKMK